MDEHANCGGVAGIERIIRKFALFQCESILECKLLSTRSHQ